MTDTGGAHAGAGQAQATQYKGFTLEPRAMKIARGYCPRIVITRPDGPLPIAQTFDVPCDMTDVTDEDEALRRALEFGRAAIDGKIPGADVSHMY